MKFRKKPVEIEAVQWKASADVWKELQQFCPIVKPGEMGAKSVIIPTLEGDMVASENDWIIKGVAGEFYPCKPDIFEKTYERVWPSPQSPPKVDSPVA